MKNIKEFDSFSVNEGIGDFFKNLFKSDSKNIRTKHYSEDDIADKIIEEMKKLDATQFKQGGFSQFMSQHYSFTLPSLEGATVVLTGDSIYIFSRDLADKHRLDISRTKALSAFNWISRKMQDHYKLGELTKRAQRASDLRTKLNLPLRTPDGWTK